MLRGRATSAGDSRKRFAGVESGGRGRDLVGVIFLRLGRAIMSLTALPISPHTVLTSYASVYSAL